MFLVLSPSAPGPEAAAARGSGFTGGLNLSGAARGLRWFSGGGKNPCPLRSPESSTGARGRGSRLRGIRPGRRVGGGGGGESREAAAAGPGRSRSSSTLD